VLAGDIETDELALPSNYFDCIICNDILEHLKDPWSVLRRLKSNLRENGCLIASIPNVRFYMNIKALLLHQDWKYESCGVLDSGHLRFFTKKSIVSMFDECGYSVLKIEGINILGMTWRMKFLNVLLGDVLRDMKFRQFACIAKIK
jgi:2-polyprenyl-3-methyl-5-hydroxy-6-metoxy-1,4-benzoquinol methylase